MELNKLSEDEMSELAEVLSRDEDRVLFVKVTKGQIKNALFEKVMKEIEAKPKEEKPKEAEKGSKEEDEDIVVEE